MTYYRRMLTPEYFADAFCRSQGEFSRPRGLKALDEWYNALAFAFWLRVRGGLDCSIRLLDLGGIGEPDCEFTYQKGKAWVEQFGLYFPVDKLEVDGAVHRLDRLVRRELQGVAFPITTAYASYRDLPMDGRLRLLARGIGQDLALQLSTSEEASVEAPVRVTAKRSQMGIVTVGTSDIATPAKAREAFVVQMQKEFRQALTKLRKYDIQHGCVLITTDHTNAAQEVQTAFAEIDPDLYTECGGVFWLNARRPFTIKVLHEREALFAATV